MTSEKTDASVVELEPPKDGESLGSSSSTDHVNGAETRQWIIWKDRQKSNPRIDSNHDCQQLIMEDLSKDESMVFNKFMKAHNCYDLIPTSSKLLVFDTHLPVKKAFFALIYNGLRAAPLWDSDQGCFVGMLTITDFIKILQKYYKSPQGHMSELEEHKVSTWRDELREYTKPLQFIVPEFSLYDAVEMLCRTKVHRLPVIDDSSGNVLYILTHQRILRFLYLYIYDLPQPSFMNRSVSELGIGTFTNILTATMETALISAINKFAEHRISALPVVDANGCLIDIYAKFDVINLAADKTYDNLDVTIGESFKTHGKRFEGVKTCKKTEALGVVMSRLVEAEVHRLVVVDDGNKVEGIVSLSDILHYIVLNPTSNTDGKWK